MALQQEQCVLQIRDRRGIFTGLCTLALLVLLICLVPAPASGSAPDREQQVRKAVEAFSEAFEKADAATLRAMLTDDYVHINGRSGNMLDGAAWLLWIGSRRGDIESGKLFIESYRVDQIKINLHGGTAIVTGVVSTRTQRDGVVTDHRIRFANVWVEQDQHWRRAAFHDSPLPPQNVIQRIAELRLAGQLETAREEAETALRENGSQTSANIALHLELAKIHDRVGLHTNTRPATEALSEIERAAVLVQDDAQRGAVQLALASYYYRVEMADRVFTRATVHARQAINLLGTAGDTRRLSEAIHQLGLIHLQQAEYEQARESFEESLRVDKAQGVRNWMLGEYHRHIGYVEVLNGNWNAALPHFEQSLHYRKQAGATDASLFAAISLGQARLRTGNIDGSEAPLKYALDIADHINSPVGTARAAIVLGEIYEEQKQLDLARSFYLAAEQNAAAVDNKSLAARAREAIDRL